MKLWATLLCACVLVACGGGGGGDSPTPNPGSGVTPLYSLGGGITGLGGASGLTLSNGAETLPIDANASTFSFATQLAQNTGYNVTVASQPAGLNCSVNNGAALMGANHVSTVAVACIALPTTQGPPTLALFAGNMGGPGYVDGSGAAARFNAPRGIATDSAGNVYVADTGNGTIRKITPAGVVSTLAGTAGVGGSADGIGTAASFYSPIRVASDSVGNVYVTETGYVNQSVLMYPHLGTTIRKITPTGVVSTLAGTAGVSGSADGIGAAARFGRPVGVATDSAGNVYVADNGRNTIRKITAAGVVSTVVGVGWPHGFAPGALPGGLSSPVDLAIHGTTLYITMANGIAVVTNLP